MSEVLVAACLAASSVISSNYHNVKDLKVCQEVERPDEPARFAEYANQFHAVHAKQQATNEQTQDTNQIVWRGMHAKGHGCFTGKLTVTTQDASLQAGFFKKDATYPVVARFSNGSGNFAKDQKRDLRGLALKVSGIDGQPLVGEKWEVGTQDFLMTNAPQHHTKDIDELMGFINAMAGSTFDKVKFFVGHPKVLTTLLGQTGREVHSLLGESYYSRAAFTWGDGQAVKYAAIPCEKLGGGDSKEDPNYLTEDLTKRMGSQGACFNLTVQKQLDAKEQPIENHRKLWKTTHQVVAKVSFEPQAGDFSDTCEKMKFNPWNGVREFKPLGNFNRARGYIYKASQNYRQTR